MYKLNDLLENFNIKKEEMETSKEIIKLQTLKQNGNGKSYKKMIKDFKEKQEKEQTEKIMLAIKKMQKNFLINKKNGLYITIGKTIDGCSTNLKDFDVIINGSSLVTINEPMEIDLPKDSKIDVRNHKMVIGQTKNSMTEI